MQRKLRPSQTANTALQRTFNNTADVAGAQTGASQHDAETIATNDITGANVSPRASQGYASNVGNSQGVIAQSRHPAKYIKQRKVS